MSKPISISCKCITYGRVNYLEESIESFLKQDYDGDSELVIVNDYPLQKLHFNHPKVRIINLNKTFNTIGEKENYAVKMCRYDTIAVWDDDDLALPNHLSNINKHFPGHDLLHWNNGILMMSNKIEKITDLGNSGIVYSKDIWNSVGRHEYENAGYDATFVLKIYGQNGIVNRAITSIEDVSWIYCWNDSYHMSAMGNDTPDRKNVIIRHSEHIEQLRLDGKIPTGIVYLKPHWKNDYNKMYNDFLK